MQYCIDYIYYDNNRINCRGWAAPDTRGDTVTVSLVDEAGRESEASVEYTKRPDVLEYLYHEGGEEKYGFLLTAWCDTKKNFQLKAVSEKAGEEALVLDIRQMYRHRTSFLSFLRAKDKKQFLLQKKLGDLQPEDLYYHQWYLKHRVRPSELKKQRKERFSYAPCISVLVPVYNPEMSQFDAMTASVRAQSYENWQLCLANGSKDNEEVNARLKTLAASDPRIKIRTLEKNGGISENTNACLEMADGEWCALLDQDDLYEPDALYEFVKAMNAHPDAEIIYSDEDKLDDETGAHLTPHFKPDYSPARLHSDNYICHLLMAKTALMRKVGGERSAYDGAQDFDLVLRLTEETKGELERMRDNCDEIRDLAIIDMLASTGMRIGEMVLLNREDINFAERECIVFGKGDKERVVYFDARTKLHLQEYLNRRTDNNAALFVSLRS
ncbi:MAG: glycosyltransferase, partial [Lachnospiraceae bacterium]|nr:glycosyltransferase [Lachnospiraceae bacterium]